jgi:hypothetical protein
VRPADDAAPPAEGVILSKDRVEGPLVSGMNIIFRGGFEFEFVPFLWRHWRATCQCCVTTDVVGVILSKYRVEVSSPARISSSEVASSSSSFMMYSVKGLIVLTAPGMLGAGEFISVVG